MTTSNQKAILAFVNESVPDIIPNVLKGLSQFAPSCKKALKAYESLSYDDLSWDVDPNQFGDYESYLKEKVAASFLKKLQLPACAAQAKQKAEETFALCEAANLRTNVEFQTRCRTNVRLGNVLSGVQAKIQRILGPFHSDVWLDNSRFGPGLNTGVDGESLVKKVGSEVTMTPLLAPFAEALFREIPCWERSKRKFVTVPGGRYSRVPKTHKTDRNIEIQPLLNSFLQAGLGRLIRTRLRKMTGIDLSDQSKNQELARQGSINGFYATIDLSNASDMISRTVVRECLSLVPDWLHALEITRTECLLKDDSIIPLERFSSMGNGFSFELETLIFWSICKEVCELHGYHGVILVYGDDIIVPSHLFAVVCETLEQFGFSVNKLKSFHTGPFRESCGADWFNGVNVRPYFLKEIPQDVASLISLANGLCRLAGRPSNNVYYDRRFAPAWYVALRWIRPTLRRRLAFGCSTDDSFVLHPKRFQRGKVLQFKLKKDKDLNWLPSLTALLYKTSLQSGDRDLLSSSNSSGDGHLVDYRRGQGKWKLRDQPFHDYVVMGDWR